MRRLLPLVGVLLLAVACGSSGAGGHVADPQPSSTRSDAIALVGTWTVDAEGEDPGSAIALGEGLRLFLSCGVLDGDWRADSEQSLFVGDVSSGDEGCFDGTGPPEVPWVTDARGFRVDGDTRRLVDGDGKTLAVLRPGAHPTVGPNRIATDADPPVVSPSMRAAAREPAPLPQGVVAAVAEKLQRRWVPVGAPRGLGRAYVTFGTSGRWRGSDGCNGAGGRYMLGRDGRLLATSGPSTLVGCDNSPVGQWVAGAARAASDGDDLVFYDAGGTTLGRVSPAPDQASPLP